MLSAESAVGAYPVKAVQAMDRVCRAAERQQITSRSQELLESHFERIDESIAMASVYTAQHMHADAILALTESGDSALLMSRLISRFPIYALTPHRRTRGRMALCRGVYPIDFDTHSEKVAQAAIDRLKQMGLLQKGHRIIMTKGDHGLPGGTNTLKILQVE